ncbi:hypothetical protein EMCRGX_G006403 [Ephydatia muelleri]
MILHLSAPEGHSINDYISKDEFNLHYSTIDDAVALLGKFQRGALMAKLDLQAAFRMVPIRPSEWELLGMHWRGQYYVDTCLSFGLRSAPSIFNEFASALHWILEHNYGATLLHYLDDFLLLGPPGLPTCGPSRSPFLRRLIHLSTTVQRLHHRIHLNTDARADIEWWDHFLPSWNGIAMFIAPEWNYAEAIHLFTDASGTLGFEAFFNGALIRGDWQPHQQLPGRSISGKSYSPLLQQPSLGDTTCLGYASRFTVITSPSSRLGQISHPNNLKSWNCSFSQQHNIASLCPWCTFQDG